MKAVGVEGLGICELAPQNDMRRQSGADEAAFASTEHQRPEDAHSDAAAPPSNDPIALALEAALMLRQSGAGPKELRRALRLIEELLDA